MASSSALTRWVPQGVFPFHLLPPELREMILRYAAYQPNGIHLLGRFGHDPFHPSLSNISSILALNEECRAVASRFFFELNTLHVSTYHPINSPLYILWLFSHCGSYLQYVRHLVLTNPMCEDCLLHMLQYGLPRFPELQSLTLFEPIGWESEQFGGLASAIHISVPTIRKVTFQRVEKNGGMTMRSSVVITWD